MGGVRCFMRRALSVRGFDKIVFDRLCMFMNVFDQLSLFGDLLLLDIGKTHTKLSRFRDGLKAGDAPVSFARIESPRCIPTSLDGIDYPVIDTNAMLAWCLETVSKMPEKQTIGAILPVTHGAAFALLDTDGLVFPVMDYEFEPPAHIDANYDDVRPPFAETGSPRMDCMLNAGRQLFYLQKSWPDRFAKVETIVPLAQYFAYLLSGALHTETSALGCHTDLWNPFEGESFAACAINGLVGIFPPDRTCPFTGRNAVPESSPTVRNSPEMFESFADATILASNTRA